MSFYEARPNPALRFGDVVSGYVLSAPRVDEPDGAKPVRDFHIHVGHPKFAAILTPCCSIGHKTLILSPLIEVRAALFKNPYFANDLTNINRKMSPEQTVSRETWESLAATEKEKRLSAGEAYALLECFVYAPENLLPEYTVHRREGPVQTGHYMIDFRRMHRVECDKIAKEAQAPLDTKVLQLSIETRAELRDKLAAYFGRTPDEDIT